MHQPQPDGDIYGKTFKHLAGDERRTAIEEALGDTEHKLNENLKTIKALGDTDHKLKENLKTIKLLEEKITILKRFLSDSSIAAYQFPFSKACEGALCLQRLPSKRGDFTAVLHSLFSSASVECLCWVVVVCRVHVCDSAFSRVVLFCLATQCFRGLLCFASRLSVFAVGRRARPRFRAVLRSDRAIASGLLCPTDEFAGQFCVSC